MLKQCQDGYCAKFTEFVGMQDYHQRLHDNSHWERTAVKSLHVEPLGKTSPLFFDQGRFAASVSGDAITDTVNNLGLAIQVGSSIYPVRDTAYKGLLDRAKISGTALSKLSRERLAEVLNSCLALHKDSALVLIRDEKVSAAHSGDSSDYSVLEIDQLLETLQREMDARFPGNMFIAGYSDHAITSASWSLPNQKEELLGTYAKLLSAQGSGAMAAKLMPGIQFTTSDTASSSAKVAALLMGRQYPIYIGSIIAVNHRRKATVDDFSDSLQQLFAQFGDSITKLSKLLSIQLEHPVNAMTAVAKSLKLPKKAAMEAIDMFETAFGDSQGSAHDVFMALQEVPFILKTNGASESRLLLLQETMARALTLRWTDYDLARKVEW